METISADVGVEPGDQIMFATNQSRRFVIVSIDGDEVTVEDPTKQIYCIDKNTLGAYVVAVE